MPFCTLFFSILQMNLKERSFFAFISQQSQIIDINNKSRMKNTCSRTIHIRYLMYIFSCSRMKILVKDAACYCCGSIALEVVVAAAAEWVGRLRDSYSKLTVFAIFVCIFRLFAHCSHSNTPMEISICKYSLHS